jgi:transcriptional regulator with XRE-family HTH domain
MEMQQSSVSREFSLQGQIFDDGEGLTPAKEIDIFVGSRLRARRLELGMSQAALSHCLGLTFSQVQKYEKGSNRIGAGRLYQLATLLGVPLQYFFKGLINPLPEQSDKSPQVAAEDDAQLHDALDKVPDPRTRRALLALASSLVEKN